jgi:hypothetical protein
LGKDKGSLQMNIESKLEEIKQFQKNVEVTFDRLVTNIQTPEVKEKVKHFKDIEISKISKNILQTIQVIDAPISVGLVGRYSHGKTALINEFFSMDAEYSLPEGEGIVTSKITKVEFDSKVSSPICSQVFRDRRENRISLEALKLSVSTNDTNSELIDYYSIKLPIREDYMSISEDFNKSDLYNFIVLNDENDFLIQTFIDLLSDYENNFTIQGVLPRKILESIFYTCDHNILSKTRLFQDKPEYQERMQEIKLNENIDLRHTHRSLLMVLSYLQYFCLESSICPPKITDKTPKKIGWYIRSIWNMRGIFLENDDLQKMQPLILMKRVFKEVRSLWHEASNASNTQDILFEVSKKLSSEILSTVVDLEIEQQDSSD